MPDSDPKTAVVWLDPDQVDLIRAVAIAANLNIVAVGCPESGRAAELALSLGREGRATPAGDLRAILTGHDADVVLLAAPGDFGSGGEPAGRRSATGRDDWAVLDDRRARGGTILTFEPMPASVLQLETPALIPAADQPAVALGPSSAGNSASAGVGGAEWAALVPLFRRSAAMRSAADVLAHMGQVHSINAEFVSGRAEGSLGARLFDAFDTVTSLLGEAESIDAMYVWPGRGKIVHPVVGESLRALAGVMTANLRFADGKAATVFAGDASVGAARWSRRVTIISEAGRLTVTDVGFEFMSADGQTVDRSGDRLIATAPAVIADQIRLTLDPHRPTLAPTNCLRILSATGAALLSARTGEHESPETIIRMARTA